VRIPQYEREHSARAAREREGATGCMLHRRGLRLMVQGRLVQHMLARESEHVGSNTCCNILKQGVTTCPVRLAESTVR
jgi:hypothetical protein